MMCEIMPVTSDEAETLLPILRDAEEGEERIRTAFLNPACVTYAARVDGHLVGAAVVCWNQSAASEILYIAVAEQERGKGYGKSIIAAVRAELPGRGSGSLLVGTANSSLENIAFYQKCGFRHLLQQIGERGCQVEKRRGYFREKSNRKKAILIMTNHTGDRQEAAWPLPKQEHMLHLLEESGQSLVSPVKKRAGRKPLVSWEHLVWAILHCFLHGWHAQLEVWRVITSERVGPFAPVRVCDQAIYNRIER